MIRFADVFAPEGEEARRRAAEELSRAEYQAAKPNAFDRFAEAVFDALGRLLNPEVGPGGGSAGLIVLTVVIVALLAVVILLWGRPRLNARRRVASVELLGDRDDRSAAQLRADAGRAAAAGDWSTAVILRYRALARGLLERDLIAPAPGATAQAIAREAAAVFPEEVGPLQSAATVFDGVRYLGVRPTSEHYATVSATDSRLDAHRPQAVSA